MTKKNSLLYGAHMSISGGISLAIERGQSIEATAIQIFTKSNRQWHAKPLNEADCKAFKAAWKASTIQSVITHASYLINIASSDHALAEKSVHALIDELNRCHALSIPYLVLHPGSRGGSDEGEALLRVGKNIDQALSLSEGKVSILLETMAGQGSSICHTFEQIATVLKHTHHKSRVGVCFDTCHAFAAGYDFGTHKTYQQMWHHFDTLIGLEKLHAIHINDSKGELGCRTDRHADIGKGKIGLKAFELLINDHRLAHVPKILETPRATLDDYKRNMEVLKGLVE